MNFPSLTGGKLPIYSALSEFTNLSSSRSRLWKIVSKGTIFKGGEHHTRESGTDNEEIVLAITMDRRQGRAE